ncbi:MAG: hypothetical protein ACRDZR_07815, partial [Acidimicrobiales bacterium]
MQVGRRGTGSTRGRWLAGVVAAAAVAAPLLVPGAGAGAAAGPTAVSGVSVALSNPGALARQVTYTVDLTTSASGALAGGSGMITLDAAPGTQLPGTAADYEIAGASGSVSAVGVAGNGPRGNGFAGQGQDSGPIVSLTVKTAVPSASPVVLTVHGADNPPAGSESMTVWTSADLQPVASPTYAVVAGTAVSDASVTVSTLTAGVTGATWKIGLTTGTDGGLGTSGQLGSAAGAVTVAAPGGTSFSNQAGFYSIETGAGTPISATISLTGTGSTVTVTPVSAPVGASTTLTLVVRDVVNPPPGPLDVQISTSAQPQPVTASGGAVVAPAGVSAATLSVSTPAAGAGQVQWTVGFTTSPSGGLVAGYGAGTVTLTGQAGTVFPTSLADYKIGATYPYGLSVAAGGSSVALELRTAVGPSAAVTVAIAGVTNPVAGAPLQVTVRTSSDTVPATAGASAGTAAGESAVATPTLSVSSPQVGATGTTWTVTFTTSAHGPLAAGFAAGTVTLTGAPGTVFPNGVAYYKVNGAYPAGSQVSPDGSTVTLPLGQAVAASTGVTLTVTNVTNPSTSSATLGVRTSSDLGEVVASPVPLTGTAVAPSAVTGTSLSVANPEAGAQTTWTVGLTTSASGGLAAGTGKV